MSDNFLTKKIADLPVWAWGLIVLAGGGLGFYFISKRKSAAIPTGTQASDTTSGNVLPDASASSLQPSNAPVGPGDPFPSVPVGNGTVPVIPSGYSPIYDNNGNLVGYQPPAPPPMYTPPAQQVFTGPSGVKHYTVQQGETLSSIAAKFGLPTWNSLYAIPANQAIFGKLSATQARNYMPRAGTVITLPPNTIIPGQTALPLSA